MTGQKNNQKPAKDGRMFDPSLPMRSARHEAFAQAVAKGSSADAAYKAAGYTPDRSHAAKLATKSHIVARVAVIRAQFAEISLISDKRALEILAEIVLTPIGKIGPDHFLAQEYSETPGLNGTATRIKMPSKLDALRLIGVWCGWEKGTQAEQAAAKALGGVADMMSRIRTGK